MSCVNICRVVLYLSKYDIYYGTLSSLILVITVIYSYLCFVGFFKDGLVKNNMEKLTFYSLSSPEKLDRIGEYLFQRASRDIYRRRNG